MHLFQKIRNRIRPAKPVIRDAPVAYDLWAPRYDEQPDNLMLHLDEQLLLELMATVPMTNRVVVDIGCGTGRHWKKILNEGPSELVGYDVSDGMLTELKKKFPGAQVQLVTDDTLSAVRDDSVDVVLSTLTIAHLPDIRAAIAAWSRILRRGGDLLITDFHPDLLARGGQRDFRAGRQHVIIRNQVYPLPLIESLAQQGGLERMACHERLIDESLRPFYEAQNALPVYERFKGLPVIYGLHFRKP